MKNNSEIDHLWAVFERALFDHVPGRAAREIQKLVASLVEAEVKVWRDLVTESTDRMMQGEALRSEMMLDAILGGAYDHLTKPTQSIVESITESE